MIASLMYDLGKIKTDMCLYFILQQVDNINSLKYIWACEYNKDNMFYTKMIDHNNSNNWGISITTLFRHHPTYNFIKLFFALDSVAHWKLFVRYNIENIVPRTFNYKPIGIVIKYSR